MIKKIKNTPIKTLYNEEKQIRGILFQAKEFEKIVEQMEDFVDIIKSEKVLRKKNQKFYTFKEVSAMVESKP